MAQIKEPGPKVVHVKLPEDVHRRLKVYAATIGKSMNELLLEAALAYCKGKK
jgi:plasmid stability protein